MMRVRSSHTSLACTLALAASLAGATPVSAADTSAPLAGASHALGNGSGFAWIRRNAAGVPTAFGISFDDAALLGLGSAESKTSFALPSVAGLPFRTIVVDWNPHGHPPAGTYDVPHFDFHAYTIDEATRDAIVADGPAALATPAPDLVPAGYLFGSPTIPRMGMHYVAGDAPEFHKGTFAATPIYGYWNAHLAFVESMITLAFLNGHPTTSGALARPARVETPGRYPQRWTVAHDAATGRYEIGFADLVAR